MNVRSGSGFGVVFLLLCHTACAGEMEPKGDGPAPGDSASHEGPGNDSSLEAAPPREASAPDAQADSLLPDSPSASYGPNMIQNGGFESGSSSYTGVGQHWESNDAKSHSANHSLDTTHKHGGATSQKIDTKGVWDQFPIRQVTNYGSVTPGRTYRLRAWVRSQGNTNPNSHYVIGIWWFYNDGKVGEKLNAKQPSTSYDWRQITIEAQAPAKANRLAAFLSAHYHGVVWYDDVEARERK